MKLPVTFLNPTKFPVLALKVLQAAPRIIPLEVGLDIEQVVSVDRKYDPSMFTEVPSGPFVGLS
jgi:hypothetical protein